jgi:apolipoprotein D and lipocalin family protein
MKFNTMVIPALVAFVAVVSGCGTQGADQSPSASVMDTSLRSTETDQFLVESVDLTRYVGEWFEIAALPRPFQSFCSKTKAQYEIISDKEVSVINTCKVGFAPITIEGRARVVDEKSNAVLEVTLANKKADYRIIALDVNYQYALVTNKDRSALFVLSRSIELEESIYNTLLDRAKLAGVDISKVKKTDQK